MGANKFMIGMQGDSIISMKLGLRMSEEDALNLAAWIVATVCDEEKWKKAQEAVEG